MKKISALLLALVASTGIANAGGANEPIVETKPAVIVKKGSGGGAIVLILLLLAGAAIAGGGDDNTNEE